MAKGRSEHMRFKPDLKAICANCGWQFGVHTAARAECPHFDSSKMSQRLRESWIRGGFGKPLEKPLDS